jgi:hypothetical protein
VWLLLLASFVALVGCEVNKDVEHAYPQIDIRLSPSASQQALNVTKIKIIIVGESPETIEFPVNPGERQLDVSIVVPIDATSIRVEAYEPEENDQERLALQGGADLTGLDKAAQNLTILLDPVTAHIKLRASRTELGVDELLSVEVFVAEVSKLHTMSFEIEYDDDLLEPLDVSQGQLFGENSQVFHDIGLRNSLPGRISIALFPNDRNAEITDSGVAAVIAFQTKAVGLANVRILGGNESEYLTMKQANGELITDFERLEEFLSRATVAVSIR